MARYGQKFKERVVARLLPPESSPVEAVSQTVGISIGTLERWRAEVLAGAEFSTIRLRLLKIAVRVRETASRIKLAFAANCPEAPSFRELIRSLVPRPT